MTNNEFKAWFEGYTEEMKDSPTKAQWKKIKVKVKEMDGNSVWRYYQPYWNNWTYISSPGQITGGTSTADFTLNSSVTMYMSVKTYFSNELTS